MSTSTERASECRKVIRAKSAQSSATKRDGSELSMHWCIDLPAGEWRLLCKHELGRDVYAMLINTCRCPLLALDQWASKRVSDMCAGCFDRLKTAGSTLFSPRHSWPTSEFDGERGISVWTMNSQNHCKNQGPGIFRSYTINGYSTFFSSHSRLG